MLATLASSAGFIAAETGSDMRIGLHMANPVSTLNVSCGFHDMNAAVMHTANMAAKRPKTRWFLKQWRQKRGYTQDRLAEMTGLSKPYISQLERGERQYTQDLLEVFAEALGCDYRDLVIRDPSDPEGIWSVWENASQGQRSQIVRMAKVITGDDTGTDG